MTTAWRCAPCQWMRRIQIIQWSGSRAHNLLAKIVDAGGFVEESGIVLMRCLAAPRQIVWPPCKHMWVRQYLPAVTSIKIFVLLPGAILTSKSGECLERQQPGLTWFLRNLIRDKHNQGDDATKFCSDRIRGSYFIMQTNQLLLISATAVTLVQGHLVHFHRPILSFSQISKVKLKRFDMRSKRHCGCGGDRDGRKKNWKHKVTPDQGDLTHWGRNKTAAISQTTFSNAFSWMKTFEFWLQFHWISFPKVELTIFQHWFRYWLGTDKATSHYMNQWWLVYWRIYASFRFNELIIQCWVNARLQ